MAFKALFQLKKFWFYGLQINPLGETVFGRHSSLRSIQVQVEDLLKTCLKYLISLIYIYISWHIQLAIPPVCAWSAGLCLFLQRNFWEHKPTSNKTLQILFCQNNENINWNISHESDISLLLACSSLSSRVLFAQPITMHSWFQSQLWDLGAFSSHEESQYKSLGQRIMSPVFSRWWGCNKGTFLPLIFAEKWKKRAKELLKFLREES